MIPADESETDGYAHTLQANPDSDGGPLRCGGGDAAAA